MNIFMYEKQLVVKRANYNLAADVKQTLYLDTYCNYSKYYCVFVSQFGNIKYLAIPFPLNNIPNMSWRNTTSICIFRLVFTLCN